MIAYKIIGNTIDIFVNLKRNLSNISQRINRKSMQITKYDTGNEISVIKIQTQDIVVKSQIETIICIHKTPFLAKLSVNL